MKTNTLRTFTLTLLTSLTLFGQDARAVDLGTVGTETFDAPGLSQMQFEFRTTSYGDAESYIYLVYPNYGRQYTIDLYSNGVWFATTSAYLANPLPYLFPSWNSVQATGGTVDLGGGMLMTYIGLNGLPPGRYSAQIAHHAGFSTYIPYTLNFTLPGGGSTGGGSTGGGSTGGGNTGGGNTGGGNTGGGNTGGGNTGGGNTGGGNSGVNGAVAGQYDGSLAPESNGWSIGQVQVKVNAKGGATGTLIYSGEVFRFKGNLGDGQTIERQFTRRDGRTLAMTLKPNFASGRLDAEVDSGADFLWTSRAKRVVYGRGNPAPNTGKCNLATDEVRSEWDTTHPEGSSTARMKFTAAGRFTCAGRLSDGTPFSAGGFVHPGSGSDTFSFAKPMRTKKDGAGSMLTVHEGEVSGGAGSPSADFWADWVRRPKASQTQYPDGFWIYQHFAN